MVAAPGSPALASATHWESVAWGRHSHIIVTGTEAASTRAVAAALSLRLGYQLLLETSCVLLTNSKRETFESEGATSSAFLRSIEHVVADRPTLLPDVHAWAPKLNRRDLVVFVAAACPLRAPAVRLPRRRARGGLHNASAVLGVGGGREAWRERGGASGLSGRDAQILQTYMADVDLRRTFDPSDSVCTVKQDVWLRYQLPRLRAAGAHATTVAFDSFTSMAEFETADGGAAANGVMGGTGGKQVRPFGDENAGGGDDAVRDGGAGDGGGGASGGRDVSGSDAADIARGGGFGMRLGGVPRPCLPKSASAGGSPPNTCSMCALSERDDDGPNWNCCFVGGGWYPRCEADAKWWNAGWAACNGLWWCDKKKEEHSSDGSGGSGANAQNDVCSTPNGVRFSASARVPYTRCWRGVGAQDEKLEANRCELCPQHNNATRAKETAQRLHGANGGDATHAH
eukprot:1068818-Pleurochrysis_carterae.AAC.1